MPLALKDDKSVEQAYFELNSGDRMPALGLGTWKAHPNDVQNSVLSAIVDYGYKHIDCAFIYGNEVEVGIGLHAAFEAGIKREDVWVTSKLWMTSNSPEKVKGALMTTLNDLDLEYLDLYLVHWPLYSKEDASTPPKEGDILPYDIIGVWKVMESLVQEKLVRNIGISNFSVPKLELLLKEATILPAVHQVEIHPAWRNETLLEHANKNKYHVTAYSPLASSEVDILDDPAVTEVAERVGKQPAQVVIRWLIQRGVSTIAKSSSENRIKENMQVFGWSLSAEDMDKISSVPHQVRTTAGASMFVEPGENEEKKLKEFWGGGV